MTLPCVWSLEKILLPTQTLIRPAQPDTQFTWQMCSVSGLKPSQSRHSLTGVATALQVSCVWRLQAVCCASAEHTCSSCHCWGPFKCAHRQVGALWLDYDYVIHLLCQRRLHMRDFTLRAEVFADVISSRRAINYFLCDGRMSCKQRLC